MEAVHPSSNGAQRAPAAGTSRPHEHAPTGVVLRSKAPSIARREARRRVADKRYRRLLVTGSQSPIVGAPTWRLEAGHQRFDDVAGRDGGSRASRFPFRLWQVNRAVAALLRRQGQHRSRPLPHRHVTGLHATRAQRGPGREDESGALGLDLMRHLHWVVFLFIFTAYALAGEQLLRHTYKDAIILATIGTGGLVVGAYICVLVRSIVSIHRIGR